MNTFDIADRIGNFDIFTKLLEKIVQAKSVLSNNAVYNTSYSNNIPLTYFTCNFSNNPFFLSTIFKLKRFDPKIRNSHSCKFFKENIIKFIRILLNSVIQCHSPQGTKNSRIYDWTSAILVTINLNTISRHSKSVCNLEAETTSHFILHCPYYKNGRRILLTRICDINSSILERNEPNIMETLPYGNDNLSYTQNTDTENATVKYLLFSKINLRKSLQNTCLNLIHFEPKRTRTFLTDLFLFLTVTTSLLFHFNLFIVLLLCVHSSFSKRRTLKSKTILGH